MKQYIIAAALLTGASTNALADNAPQQVPAPKPLIVSGVFRSTASTAGKIYLAIVTDAKARKRTHLDSTLVKDGRFRLVVNRAPGKYELGTDRGEYFSICLDQEESRVTIDSSFKSAKVSGNVTDSLVKAYDKLQSGRGFMQLGLAVMAKKYKEEGKEVPDSVIKTMGLAISKLSEDIDKAGRTIGLRKDLAAAYVLQAGGADLFSRDELNAIYEDMAPYVKAAPFGQSFKTLLDKINSVAVGVKAPAFVQENTEGKPLQLTEFVKGKKLVLIDFWASWCGPCRKENPNVVALYDEYKSKGFDILGVSLDSKKEDWLKAIADDKLTWAHVSDLGGWKNKVAIQYNVSAVPHTILVDGNGVIVAKNLRGKALEDKLAEVLGK